MYISWKTVNICVFIMAMFILGVLICKEYAALEVARTCLKPVDTTIGIAYELGAEKAAANWN